MRRMFGTAAVMLLSAALALTACGGGGGGQPAGDHDAAPTGSASAAGGPVVVGSFDFPESVLLGSIYAQALEAKGVQVEEKLRSAAARSSTTRSRAAG